MFWDCEFRQTVLLSEKPNKQVASYSLESFVLIAKFVNPLS